MIVNTAENGYDEQPGRHGYHMSAPNILVIMTDHQRADTVLRGHPVVSPNLNQLAADGIAFTSAYCPSPHCCPARATFFTGHYPSRHGVWNNLLNEQRRSDGLSPGVRLWSDALAEAGWQLDYCGKWHVDRATRPSDRGWREHEVNAVVPHRHGPDWDQYRRLASVPAGRGRPSGTIIRPGYGDYRLYGTAEHDATSGDERSTAAALEVLSRPRGGSPWCLYVGLVGPHDPYIAPQRFLDLYPHDRSILPESWTDCMRDKPGYYQRLRDQVFGQLSEAEIIDAVRHYRAYCSYMDELTGRILAALAASGQAEDTLVLFTSDHGDYAGEHGLFAKGIPCFTGAYRVPMLMRWPRGVHAPGRCEDAFVSLADIAPTVLELAGLPVPEGLAGRSLTPYLAGRRPGTWRDDMHFQCDGVEIHITQRAVRTERWHFTWNPFDRDELYDLAADPHQLHNLAADPAYTGVVRTMCRRLWRFAQEHGDGAINDYVTVGLAPFGPAEAFASA